MNENAKVVLEVFAALESRDGETFLKLCRPDAEFSEAESLPYGGTQRLDVALAEGQPTWLGTWDPLQPTERERRMDPEVLGTGTEHVIVRYHQRAVDAEGRRFDGDVLAIYDVRNGLLAKARMFHSDTEAVNRFLERASG
jgi:ketosteroid isomerase-like protein